MRRSGHLPATYHSNPVVRQKSASTQPLGLYLDYVAFAKTDKALGFFFVQYSEREELLCAVLRRSQLCRCGCRGWCTYFQIFVFFPYCIAALAAGVYPRTDYRGKEFVTELDKNRKELEEKK